MSVTTVAQYVSDAFAVALILRLLMLRLHAVYRVFCAFLLVDLLSSLLFFITRLARGRLDYRIAWMAVRPVVWVLSLWMVYALLGAMLANLPGILRVSRRVLNGVFVLALLFALMTARPEYSASALAGSADPVNRLVAVVYVLERVIFMSAAIALVAMLLFILWFPVQMPRNLAVFSVGFVVFFSTGTIVLLLHTYWSPAATPAVTNIATFALAACYAYWLLLIDRLGEIRRVRIGHSWEPGTQQRMIGELEAINAALLRASRR